jgi:hypothetical protein
VAQYVEVTMSSDDRNPYAAPKSAINDTQPRERWRIVPTTALAVLGSGSFAIGLRCAFLTVSFLSDGNARWRPMAVVSAVWLSISLSWIVAARFMWKQRYRNGVIAALIGLLIPIVLFSLF